MKNTFIIAEAGVNHNGDIEIAKKMIDIASAAGVDAVKFQTFRADTLVAHNAPKASYQVKNMSSNESQYDMLQKLELTEKEYIHLSEYCMQKNVMFLSSPFDLESIDMLESLGMTIYKIPSGEITNLPYLRKIGSLKKKIIMSTGMANLGEIEQALDILILNGTSKEDITLLHCNTEYPTPFEDVNLLAMQTLRDAFKIKVGYSDHSLGLEVPIAAVALGAEVIEKHFTIDNAMIGPDHKASLDPSELKQMVVAVRNVEQSIGNGIKYPSQSEIKNMNIVRKSIFTKQDISKGDIFSTENITTKRPGIGISPMRWDEIIGKISLHDYQANQLVEL